MRARFVICLMACWSLFAAQTAPAADRLVVGSKRFTESYILGEIIVQTLQAHGVAAEHRPGLGNTGILEQALASGAIDMYPEYTGTIVRELLKRDEPGNPSIDQLNAWLAPRSLKVAVPLGFNNTYALAMLASRAQTLGITKISDLLRPGLGGLRLGLSHEFLQRGDGWPALKAAYHLTLSPGNGLDHGLAYDAITSGRVDVIDVYTTDAKIERYRLRVLQDDIGFFPKYEAVILMRAAVDPRPLSSLKGRIDADQMRAMNAAVELDGQSFAEVARRFVAGERPAGSRSASSGSAASGTSAGSTAKAPDTGRQSFIARLFAPDFARLAWQHLLLVFGSLAMAIVVGVPLGIAAWRWPAASGMLLGTTAVLQTIPSLALLAFLIALMGTIGLAPALVALFLYALLPIVRNTFTGLIAVPHGVTQAALSLGLTPFQCLAKVQLPLALPVLLAGVKTAGVINVGTATMAAFIGAGGFGERIVAGLAINDTLAMLAGAIPAAVMALMVETGFGAIERWLIRAPRP